LGFWKVGEENYVVTKCHFQLYFRYIITGHNWLRLTV